MGEFVSHFQNTRIAELEAERDRLQAQNDRFRDACAGVDAALTEPDDRLSDSLGPEQLPAAVTNLKAERDRLRAAVDDWEQTVTEKALIDAGKVVWLEACMRGLETERDRLRADLNVAHAELEDAHRFERDARQVEAERDRLRAIVDIVRDAFLRPDDEEWRIDTGALVVLADALDQLDSDTPPAQRILADYTRDLVTERDRLRGAVQATATDARVMVKALAHGSLDAVVELAERIYNRHAPWDVGEAPDESEETEAINE
jgi:hypothetical protein